MFYHPAVMRAFKEFRPEDTRHRGVREIHKLAEEHLIFLESRIHKPRIKYQTPVEVEKRRRLAGSSAARAVAQVKTDKELMTVAACLAILVPRSAHMWVALDQAISDRAADFSVDAVVLCAHTILCAVDALGTRKSTFRTPQVAANILAERWSSGDGVFPSATIRPADDLIFAAVVGSRVEHSPAVEQVGLYMHILQAAYRPPYHHHHHHRTHHVSSSSPPLFPSTAAAAAALSASASASEATSMPRMKKTLEMLSVHCLRTLSESVNPVKFLTLRTVWEQAPLLDLPNSYDLYKALYDQVLYSISTEPLQVVNQEEAVTTLLESMKKARFKNGRLINEVCKILGERGFSVDKHGVRMFGALVELDAVPFAMRVMTDMLNADMMYVPEKNNFSSTASDEAKDCIDRMLAQTAGQAYRSADLIIALSCLGGEDKRSKYYRRVEVVEAEVCGRVADMKLSDVLNLLNCYGYCGRHNPAMIAAINRVVEPHAASLSYVQVGKILWANARLNNRAPYHPTVVARFSEALKGKTRLNPQGIKALARDLWSMAVLEVVEQAHYDAVEHLLWRHSHLGDGSEMHPWVVQQLLQVLTELRCKDRKRTAAADAARARSGVVSSSSSSSDVGGAGDGNPIAAAVPGPPLLPTPTPATMAGKNPPVGGSLSIHMERPWERTQSRIFTGSSSFTHKVPARPSLFTTVSLQLHVFLHLSVHRTRPKSSAKWASPMKTKSWSGTATWWIFSSPRRRCQPRRGTVRPGSSARCWSSTVPRTLSPT
jgi:hypothetical protein